MKRANATLLRCTALIAVPLGLISCKSEEATPGRVGGASAFAQVKVEKQLQPKISPPVGRMIGLADTAMRSGAGLTRPSSRAEGMAPSGELDLMVYALEPTTPEQSADLVRLGARIEWVAKAPANPNAPRLGAIEAWIPYDVVDAVAALPWVTSVHAAEKGKVNVGTILSEGVAEHQANKAQLHGITGAGVTVGVISDGDASRAISQASNDLPGNCPGPAPCLTTLDQGSGDEGTAMMEIVADMAPGANLAFHTSGNPQQHTQARDDLVTAGATVIAEDIAFDQEPVFQEGWVAQHIDTLAGNGVSVHSSSGNLGQSHARRVPGTGTGQTPNNVTFNTVPPPGCVFTPNNVVELGPNHETVIDVTVFPNTATRTNWNTFELQWSEPRNIFPTAGQGGFTDVDMFLMADDLQSCITAPAVGAQVNGIGDTLEVISFNFDGPAPVDAKLVINIYNTSTAVAAPTLDLRFRGIAVRATSANIVSNAGSLDPQNNFVGQGFSVGATIPNGALQNWHGRGPLVLGSTTICPGGTAGPCTGIAGAPFNIQVAPTEVSVQGVSVFGSGGFGGPGPCPGSPTVQGQCVFGGTSASAPSSAGCDALVRQALGASATLTNVRNRLLQTATRLGVGVPNNDAGFGELNCWSAIGGPTARCHNVTASANATCQAAVTPQMVDSGSTDPFGLSLTLSLTPSSPFALGSTPVTLDVSNGQLSDSCTATVTVQDTTPPTVTAPPDVTTHLCQATGSVSVGTASATDNCAAALSPTGQVVSKNGAPLPSPIPVVGGAVTLDPGTYTIAWTASDGVNPPVTQYQTVTVGVGIETSKTFLLNDRARILNATSGPAAVFNAGTIQTTLGTDTVCGGIVSVAPVRVGDRSVVSGDITSHGSVVVSRTATVSGTITTFGTVALPALPALPAFPPPTGTDQYVNSGEIRILAPGSYRGYTINSGGRLVLTNGDYYFTGVFMVNSASTVQVAPGTRIFVSGTVAYRSQFILAGGAPASIFFGLATATNTVMEAPFNGTLLAPNGQVTFGTGSGLEFRGSFLANSIEVRPGSRLVCL